MVGKTDEQQQWLERSQTKGCCGTSCLSPVIIPVVTSFKRLYKRRVVTSRVFKGKPLHTIEESNELFQNSLHNQQTAELEDETLKNDKNQDLLGDKSINETDSLISEIRHLFSCFDSSVSEERTRYDTEEEDLECQGTSDCENRNEKPCPEGNRTNQFGACESKCLTSPSCNLMQQFETAAKTEAAALIQFWYRGMLERKSYLKKRRSAVVLQRHVRSFLASR